MKYLWIIALSVGMLANVAQAEEGPSIKNDDEKVNYSLGYQIGGELKGQNVSIHSDLVIRGIQDAVSGEQPLMAPADMRTTLVELRKRVVAEHREKQRQAAEQNRAEGEAFLAKNAKKDGVTTLPSGLQYKVLAEGEGATPKATDSVTVHYRGTLIDGTEFDSSLRREKPATFAVNRVIAGWTEALQLMQAGDKWQIFIPQALGYGQRGAGKIPPNSALVFEVELLSVNTE
jgi:FKBP-type peptidyl-prolyl cis-trans isomerase